MLGKISGSVDCSGNAAFKNSGKILGSMHCKHIVIDRKCELDFPQGIIAESADIYGTVRGNMLCSGTIHIHKTGSVLGDATARAILMKDGGVLTGQMNIRHDIDISLPERGSARPDRMEVTEKETAAPVIDKNDSDQKDEEELETKQDPPDQSAEEKEKLDKKTPKTASKTPAAEPKTSAKDENTSSDEDDESFELTS